jgi:hypothetical protein
MAITATEMATAILQFQSGSAVKDTEQILILDWKILLGTYFVRIQYRRR